MTRRFERSAAVLASILLAVSCQSEHVTPTAKELIASLEVDELVNSSSVPDARPPLQIYLDASMSMQGFLALPNGRFRRALDRLLDRSVSGGYDVSVYKFDQVVAKLPGTTSTASLASRDFFVGGETSFPTLFRYIQKERKPGSIAIVITDLVQSGRTGEQRELSRAFQEMAAKRPEVLLVALRSPFVGRYWPESTLVTDSLQLDLRGVETKTSRPFYLLMIGDRVEDLTVLRRHLNLPVNSADGLAWEIDASRPAVIVTEAKFAQRLDSPEAAVWQVERRQEPLPALGRTQRGAFWLFEREAPPPDGASIRFQLTVEGELGVATVADLSVEALRCPFTAAGPCRDPEVLQLEPKDIELDGRGHLFVSYSLPRPPAGGWDGYHLRLLPGRANLTRPINAELWTTDNDAEVSQATRTYKLDLFVDTLINALREPVAFSEQFVFLGRGE